MKNSITILSLLLTITFHLTGAVRMKTAIDFEQCSQAYVNPLALLKTLTKKTDAIILFYSEESETSHMFDELSQLFPSITCIKINCTSFKELTYEYDVTRIPTMLFIHKGKIIKRHTGSIDKKSYTHIIKKIW